MDTPIFHIDAFTDTLFGGNSAAVVVFDASDARSDDAAWMQRFAAEMNLAETAFLVTSDDSWALRWFTPTVEVQLCGHATLASAHVLWSAGYLDPQAEARFNTRSGRLTARRIADPLDQHIDGRIELGLPSLEAPEAPCDPAILEALGIAEPVFCGRHPSRYQLLVLQDEAQLRSLRPDFAALRDRDESYAVTAPSVDPAFDFVSRYFAPGHGIDEDPVTGSAHCVYAPYWCTQLAKPVVVGHQISERGGIVECEPVGDRVLLRGNAITVYSGTLA